MFRAIVLATLCCVLPSVASGQTPGVLHVSIVLLDADQKPTPVAHHALLISDNPATSAPRRIVTALDGTAVVRLRPGNYTVESDQPVRYQGKAYQWTRDVDIAAGRDVVLELNTANAEIVPVTSAPAMSAPALEADPEVLLTPWVASVVELWTQTSHASGFVSDSKGLVVTHQRFVGGATSVEVQLTPALKVAGTVIVADAGRDVAVIAVAPKAILSVHPVPLGCGQAPNTLRAGQELFAISAPLFREKGLTNGKATRVDAHALDADFTLASSGTGGPVFSADGRVVGITSIAAGRDERDDTRVVSMNDVCAVVSDAERKLTAVALPSDAHLPVEPVRPTSVEALEQAAQHRAGNLSPYQAASADFDIAFITPVLAYAALHPIEPQGGPARTGTPRRPSTLQALPRPLMDFGNWTEYVAEAPPVLLLRVTPKLVEGFWTTVARGAAQTQGVALPQMKHAKAGFLRMRAFCGDVEVLPIHPFALEHNVPGLGALYEGLYVFDPDALGPQCAGVKLLMYSEKSGNKADTLTIDPAALERIQRDFVSVK